MTRLPWLAFLAAVPLSALARQPQIPHFDPQTTKVALIENGVEPLSYTTAVVNASSFWKQYGGAVGTNVGGIVGTSIESGSGIASSNRPNGADENVKQLLGENNLAPAINAALIQRLAGAWGFAYDESHVVVLKDSVASVDPNTQLARGLPSDADLVLMTEVRNVNLTERFSMGGALAAGVTLGTSRKSLTTEVSVVMRALQRNASDGTYKQIWAAVCGPNYTSMKTSYPLKELTESHEKVTEILEEATRRAIDICSRRLPALTQS
jgi:hypothetical protein